MAVKPVGIPTAFFLEPVLLQGREDSRHWRRALATIPPAVMMRLKALVSDGFRGAKRIARTHRWVLQGCHRHLDAMLWGKSKQHKRRLRGGAVRKAIIKAVREARTTPDPRRVEELYQVLQHCAKQPDLTVRIRGTVRRFLHDLTLYRTYLDYPELSLPTTTNAVESRNSRLREVLKCVNSPAAAALRVQTYTRLHPSITCNHRENPQN